MSAIVIDFLSRKSGHKPRWSNQDLAEFWRLSNIFRSAGLSVDADAGTSEEGDPWWAMIDQGSGDTLLHVAHIDGQFSASWQTGSDTDHRSLRDLINRCRIQIRTNLLSNSGDMLINVK